MQSAIYHIVYASSAVNRLSQSELVELLGISRRKNEACGVTGMLLYRDGTYLQLVEGERADVDGLLETLRKDPRHRSIQVLREGYLPQRLFPEWSMAFKNLAGLRSSDVPGYSELLQGQSDGDESNGPAQLLMEMFREILE
jgi:hypothetical protein